MFATMSLKELIVLYTVLCVNLVTCLEPKYHSTEELEQYLKNFTANNHLTTRLYSIGKSIKGHELWVVEMTAMKEEKIGTPNIKFIGTIHGNEPVGREILLYFMEYLRDNYKTNSTIRWLLDHTKIHFLPSLNSDGFDEAKPMCDGDEGRTNKRKVDLNRSFPDGFHKNMIPEQPETRAIKKWMANTPFVLSAGLHGGSLVANYPFDSMKARTSHKIQPPSLTPDDDVFKHLASTYAQHHLTMHKGEACNRNSMSFQGGITNGAAWYPLSGGMQDFNYVAYGCMELTLEISCCKYPQAKELPTFWEQNKEALFALSMEAHKGVTGQIVDSITSTPVNGARLKISGRNMTFFSKRRGEFWRLLLPGQYKLEVSADGYYDQVVPFVVKDYNSMLPELTFLNIFLINASVSTTTEQKTTETTTTTPDLTSISSTDLNTAAILADNFMYAKQISEDTMAGATTVNQNLGLRFYFVVLPLLLLL